MRKAGGILGIIGGVFAVIAALFTLFLGGVGGALQAQGAQTVIGLGWLGLLAAFLAIVLGAVVLGTRSRAPGVLLFLSAALGITGGTPVAICMVLVGIGGLLAVFGASGAQASAGAAAVALDGASAPPRRKVWRVVGGVVGVVGVLVVIAAALGSQSASKDAKTAAAGDAASARPASAAMPAPSHPAVAPAPHFVVGDTFRTPTFRVQVGSARLLDQVGGQFLNDQAAAGAVYVAVAYAYENISDKPANVFAVPSVHLVDAHGTVYDPDVEASSLYASQIHATAKEMSSLNPGITLTDGDVFEVSRAQFDPRTWKILVKSGDGNVTVDFAAAGAAVSSPQPVVASQPMASSAPATMALSQ